jgi:alpha-beta hydrolase superfamily lysophospholipase
MIHREYEWLSKDKKKIYAQSWEPDQKPSLVMNIIHGFGEHSGRYARWAELFTEKKIAVLASDLTGHGKSEGKRGHIKNYQVFLDQIDLQLEKSHELFPHSKKVLYGHSMGGNLVINYAMSKDPPIIALIVTSPWLRLTFEPPSFTLLLSTILRPFFPGLRVKGKIDNNTRSHDPVINQAVKDDPLMYGMISLRLFDQVSRKGIYAMHNIYKINRPFLLMHGSADRLTSHEASREIVTNTSKLTRLKIWDGLYHELHNEFEYKEIFDYTINWLAEMNIYNHG